jgi:hypothetical protein
MSRGVLIHPTVIKVVSDSRSSYTPYCNKVVSELEEVLCYHFLIHDSVPDIWLAVVVIDGMYGWNGVLTLCVSGVLPVIWVFLDISCMRYRCTIHSWCWILYTYSLLLYMRIWWWNNSIATEIYHVSMIHTTETYVHQMYTFQVIRNLHHIRIYNNKLYVYNIQHQECIACWHDIFRWLCCCSIKCSLNFSSFISNWCFIKSSFVDILCWNSEFNHSIFVSIWSCNCLNFVSTSWCIVSLYSGFIDGFLWAKYLYICTDLVQYIRKYINTLTWIPRKYYSKHCHHETNGKCYQR